MRKEIQLRFHNIVSKPALLYGSECWACRQRDKSRINSFVNEIFTLFERRYIKGQDQKWGNYEEMECRTDDRRYLKLSTEMEPTCS